MSKTLALILCIGTFLLVQLVTWFQLNGQFVWPWFKNNVFLLCLLGIPISWGYIEATRLSFIAFEGILWPGRLLGFGMGMLSFAVLANVFLGEDENNTQTGLYGINIHRATGRQGGTSTRVDKWSAGCQVIANNNDWHCFLDICQTAREIWGNNFTYTLIESRDIS